MTSKMFKGNYPPPFVNVLLGSQANLLVLLSMLLLMLLTTTVNAQFIPEECDDKPEFEAKEDLTLCEQYERETIYTTIGTDASSYTYASTVGFTNLFGHKVRINGTLDLNVPLLFYGAVLEFGPGAEIIIQANQTMLASDTKMYACTNMWKGITV